MHIAHNIMVCVTQQKTCARLIQNGAMLREKLDGELFVIHVASEGVNFLGNNKEAEALEYLFDKSKEAGAELTVLRSPDVVGAMVEFAEEKNINNIVLGEPPSDSNEDGIISELKKKLYFCKFYIIPAKELE